MTIIERQRLTASDVRSVCITEGLYSCGTNEDYDAMFSMVFMLAPKSIIAAEDLYPIAADILAHSDTYMDVAEIMFCLAKKITRCYEVID